MRVRKGVLLGLTTCVLLTGAICHAKEAEPGRETDLGQSQVSKQVQVLREASCTRSGLADIVCGECGAIVGFQEIEILPHSYENNVCTVCGGEGSPVHIAADTSFGKYTELTGYSGITCMVEGVPTGVIEAYSDCGDITALEILLTDSVLSKEERDTAVWDSISVGSSLTFPSDAPLILYVKAQDDRGNTNEISTDYFTSGNSTAEGSVFYLFCAAVLALISAVSLAVTGFLTRQKARLA